MLPTDFPHLRRFLRDVHRRLVLLRLFERIGIAIAIACGLALPLMAMLAWHGASATLPVLACIGLGLIGGAAWGVTQIPTMMEAAIEADRQLQWADLLGTALALRGTSGDPWRSAVLVDADRRCSGVSASFLLLRRLGPRAWSGIALLATLVLTLCAWIGSPTPSLAHDAAITSVTSPVGPGDVGNQPLLTPIAINAIRPSAAPPDGEDAAPANQPPAAPDDKSSASAPTPAGDVSDKQNAAADGQGGSLGRSRFAPSPASPPPDSVTPGRASSADGKHAGGNATSTDDSLPGSATTGGRVGHAAANQHSGVPWTSDWSAGVEAAGRALTAGEVPPADRELVRDYFQRD
jgi:hypothetical protein